MDRKFEALVARRDELERELNRQTDMAVRARLKRSLRRIQAQLENGG